MKVTDSSSSKIEIGPDDTVEALYLTLGTMPKDSKVALLPTGPNTVALYVTHK